MKRLFCFITTFYVLTALLSAQDASPRKVGG